MNIKSTLLSLFLLLILAFGSWYAFNIAEKSLEQHVASDKDPDFFMTNVEYSQMDEDGSLRDQINTAAITHFIDGDVYLFTNPYLKMLDKDKHPWEITAQQGKSNGTDKIFLWDNVSVRQLSIVEENIPAIKKLGSTKKTAAVDSFSGVVINTNSLTLYPHKKTAETDQPVTIVQGASSVQATGAAINFQTSTLKLLSKVQGQYAATAK